MKKLLMGLVLATLSVSGPTQANGSYPDKPIRFIVPASPGGAADTLARSIGNRFSEKFGQPVVVENKTGAAAIIGMTSIARSKNDGYTIGMTFSGAMSINPSLYQSLAYDPKKDFEPIAIIAKSPLVVAATPDIGVSTLKELVQRARDQPGKLTFGSAGTGSTQHLSMELLKTTMGIDMLHIPYKGSSGSIIDLQSGLISAVSENAITLMPLIQAKKIVPLAVGTTERISALPNVPSIAELGYPGYEAAGWYGLVAPAGTPASIIMKLNHAMNDLLNDPKFAASLRQQGMEPKIDTVEGFRDYISSEQAKWAQVITNAKVPVQK